MKTYHLSLFMLAFGISTAACSQDYEKLSKGETDAGKIEIAQNFADNFCNTLKAGKVYRFRDETIPAMTQVLSPDKQRGLYNQLSSQFGHYQSIDYAETWIMKNQPKMHIVRFKAAFEESPKKLEVRVVVNEDGKIAGFWIRPWLDPLT